VQQVRFFILNGMPVDEINNNKKTPFHIAINVHTETVKTLAQHGVNVKTSD
jgi:ankyrin repeat protein